MVDAASPPALSIIIPTLNAGPDFAHTLEAIQSQDIDLPFEIVIIDSGSTDGTLSLATEAGTRVIEIDSDTFHHARTRNMAAATCSGRYLVFLVQDAIPANEHWLAALVEALDAVRVVGAYSAQFAHDEASPLARRLTETFQDSLANLPPQQLDERSLGEFGEAERLALCRFDNVSSIMLRDIWQSHPFPEVEYAEDVAWAKKVLEAGYVVRRAPNSVVYHSHERSANYVMRREYVQARTLGDMLGYKGLGIERDQVIQLLRFGSLASGSQKLRQAIVASLLPGTGDTRPALRYIERLFMSDAPQRLLGADSPIPLETQQWLAHEATEDWIWRDLRLRLADGSGSRLLRCTQKAARVWHEKGSSAAFDALFGESWLFERASYRDMRLLIGAWVRRRSISAHLLQDIIDGRNVVSVSGGIRSAFLRRIVWHWPNEYPQVLKGAMVDVSTQAMPLAVYESWRMAYWLWDGLELHDTAIAEEVVNHAVAATAGRLLGEAARKGGDPLVRQVLDEQLARGV